MTSKVDGDLRMLGASDGYAHALLYLRAYLIAPIDGRYAPRIHPRHVRKLADKQHRLAPLRDLERWLVERHQTTKEAYEKTTFAIADASTS